MTTKKEDKRFSRQAKIGWFDQRKISKTNVMIIGCGGIGTWTAIQLTLLGIRKITLVDPDKIEIHNLNRQFYYEKDVGQHKTKALAEKLSQINQKVIIQTHEKTCQELTDNDYHNHQYILDCLDNIPAREYLAKKTAKLKKNFIHSACSDVIGEVQLIVPGKTKEMMPYPENMKQNEEKKSCLDFDPAICTTNMIVASLQVDKLLDHLIRNDTTKPITNYIRGTCISYGK